MSEERVPYGALGGSRTERVDEHRTDWFGVILGAATFLFGIGLLVFTFVQASQMFSTPARVALGANDNPDIARVAGSYGYVLLRIGLLLVMSIIGSVISGKGVRLYFAARARPFVHPERGA